jgi:signal transduction histidine kinase
LSDGFSLGEVRGTTTFRLAVLLGVLFCCGVTALGGLIYFLTTRELTARTDQILTHEANRLLNVPPQTLPAEIAGDVERNLHGLDMFSLLAPDGTLITGNVAPPPGLTPGHTVELNGQRGKTPPMRVMSVRAGNGKVMLIARDINEIRYLERHVLWVVVASSLLVIPGFLLIGTLLSIQPLRRLHAFQDVARRVAAGRFALRMPYTGRGDELDRIAVTVNTMIEDVGRIVEQVKNVTDAVAHDLRTPLTRLRSRLEDLRARPWMSEEPAGTVNDLIGELDIVLARFAALLRISELEAREQRSGFEAVALVPLMRDIYELYQPLAEDAEIRLSIADSEAIQVYADRSLLFEALANLVDNAIKFGRGNVSVAAWKDSADTVIAVQDDGPGIPREERDAVLRRFYRRQQADDSQARMGGSGLGLSVVSAILHLHRFRLELTDANPGLAARILIPLNSAQR